MTTPPPRTSSKSAAGGKKIFGLPRLYVYGGAIAIIAGIAFYLYKEHKASSAASSTTEGSPCTASDGTTGTYDANGNCISSDSGDTGTDDTGDLSAVQTELESLLADQGTSTSTTNVTVPQTVGQQAGAAHNILTAAGLKPTADPSQKPTDKVTSTSPAAGQSVASGSSVLITATSSGTSTSTASTVTVPALNKGETAGEMHNAIVAAGLVPVAAKGQQASWIVKSISPGSGKKVAKGSRVVINATGK